MGAAASVKLVFTEALEWFRQYFDGVSYIEDFRSLDKNGDGGESSGMLLHGLRLIFLYLHHFWVSSDLVGITYDELQIWLKEKARDHASWKVIVTNHSIFKIAHMFASKVKKTDPGDFKPVDKINGLEAFKQFLIHLFVLSILWVHFKHADEWHEGNDVGNEKLTYDEFKMACRTFSSAQANESLTEEKIRGDFALLDLDKSGSVEFIEVLTSAVHIDRIIP
jgi:hypothetical protein